MISKFFIERPVLANVLAIVLVVIGAVALYRLPVSEYPNVVPPTVQVTASYPGASAQTVLNTIALPIENQVNGVDKMLYMESTSAPDGTYTLTVTFEIGTDPNIDQVLVQNRVQLALASLPYPVQAQGVNVQKKNTAILQFVTLDSPNDKYDALFLSNYATINLVDALARLPGVGSVRVIGAGEYAMRIWMDPGKLQSFDLEPKDVINADPPAEPEHRRRADRHAARAEGRRVPVHHRRQVAPRPARGIRQHRHQGPDRPGRPPDPPQRRRADRTRLADLFPGIPPQRQAGGGHRHLSDAGLQLAAGRQGSQGADGPDGQALSRRTGIFHSLRHHDLRQGFDRRGLSHAL